MKLILLTISIFIFYTWALPLDDYVNMRDPTYKYEVAGDFSDFNSITYIINLTSQTWLSANDSDTAVWIHWLLVCVPKNHPFDTAIMYITGGDKTEGKPKNMEIPSGTLCESSHAITVELRGIPNEPIFFKKENPPKRRSEDGIIAYTWSHFINDTTKPFWILRMPMVKASVRAMDAVQDFVNKKFKQQINTFIIAGASKRSWTAWLTAAVDKRVIAVIPIVMDLLNLIPNINHHWQAYGNWSFALDDYLELGLMRHVNEPVFQQLADIEDPITYKERLTIPKYIIASCGDEFFLPDDTRYYLNSLLGEVHYRIVPNAEHSLAGHALDVTFSAQAFIQTMLLKKPRPVFTFERDPKTQQLTLKAVDKPHRVRLWHAYTIASTGRRDFRLLTGYQPKDVQPIFWFQREIKDDGTGVYTGLLDTPPSGWVGFFLEAEFKVATGPPFGDDHYVKFTSEVGILPDVFPFPPCGNHCQP